MDLKAFEKRSTLIGSLNFLITIIPFLGLVYGLYLDYYFLWPLAILFHARLFVLMHDCGHQLLTPSKYLNAFIGHICGLTYLVPFLWWRELHNKHHRFQGQLEQRHQSFDLWTMTKKEYINSSTFKKFIYRTYRNPIILFGLGPLVFFGLVLRYPLEKASQKAWLNIAVLNMTLLAFVYFGLQNPQIQKIIFCWLSIALFNFSLAVWMFYHQHVFENTYWESHKLFKTSDVAIFGSSYITFPFMTQWFTASIGFHHIHHLNTKIPFYNLASARKYLIENNFLKNEVVYRFDQLYKNLKYKLWDEDLKKMSTF